MNQPKKFFVRNGLPVPILAKQSHLPSRYIMDIKQVSAATGWKRTAVLRLHELMEYAVNNGINDAFAAAVK